MCNYLIQGGWTSLMYASRNGHDLIVDMLLEKGADPHATKEVCA